MALGDFVMDPTVKHVGQITARCPDGHVGRCQSYRYGKKNMGAAGQCGKWALKGKHYCKFHGGNKKTGKSSKVMPENVYLRAARPSLRKLIEAYSAIVPEDQIQLTSEIALSRVIAEKAMGIFEAIHFESDPEVKEKISGSMQINSAKALQEALTHVSVLCEKQAKVLAVASNVMSMEQMAYVLDKIALVVTQHFNDDPKALKECLQEITDIKPPNKDDNTINVVVI